MNQAMYEQFMKAGNVPAGVRSAIADLNQKTATWGKQGSVKRSYADSEVERLKSAVYQQLRRHYNERAAELRQRKVDTEQKWAQDRQTWDRKLAHERDMEEFAARMLSKQQLQQALAQIAGAADPGDVVTGLTSERARALMLEGRARGEKVADQAFQNMAKHGLSLAAFDHPELAYLEGMAAEYEQTPPNIVRVQHETRGEDMPIELDMLIDTESLDNLDG